MRALVCGGRDFSDQLWLNQTMDWIHAKFTINTLIHGDATGVDRLAAAWALSQPNIEILTFPADWTKYRKAAGIERNARMLRESNPELGLVFPGGRGTADMYRRMRAANVPVILTLPYTA